MSGGEFVVEPDRWTLPRRQTFGLRNHHTLPGPLKTLTRRPRRSPARLAAFAGFGCVGLALAAAFTLAPRQAVTVAAEPVAVQVVADNPAPRVVRAVASPIPVAPPSVASIPAAAEPPVLRSTVAEPEPTVPSPAAPSPAPRQAAAPALDLGPLPILELDATAFEPPVAEAPPRPTAKPHARTSMPRLAAQP